MLTEEIMERQREKIRELQLSYNTDLEEFKKNIPNKSLDFTKAHSSGIDFFNYLEEIVSQNNSTLDGEHNSWHQWLAETCYHVLMDIVEHYKILKMIGKRFQKPSPTSFSAMQRIVKKYFSSDIHKELKNKFLAEDLPVYGFNVKERINMKRLGLSILVVIIMALLFVLVFFFNKIIPIPLSIGLLFTTLLVIISIYVKNPTPFQYFIFRSLLSVCIPGLLVCFPGFIEVSYEKAGMSITAIGLLAIFLLIYKMNPAKLMKVD